MAKHPVGRSIRRVGPAKKRRKVGALSSSSDSFLAAPASKRPGKARGSRATGLRKSAKGRSTAAVAKKRRGKPKKRSAPTFSGIGVALPKLSSFRR